MKKLDIITARLQKNRHKTDRHSPEYSWRVRLAIARTRRWHLAQLCPALTRLIVTHRGRIEPISLDLGYDERATRHAIWDLGLWPSLVAARKACNG